MLLGHFLELSINPHLTVDCLRARSVTQSGFSQRFPGGLTPLSVHLTEPVVTLSRREGVKRPGGMSTDRHCHAASGPGGSDTGLRHPYAPSAKDELLPQAR